MSPQSRSWNTLIKKPLSEKELVKIITNLKAMPDRGVALVGSGIVERSLEYAIAQKMRKMGKKRYNAIFQGPLRGFSQKIQVGYGLSVFVHKGAKELEKIRKIRNAFAHTVHDINFTTPRIKSHCDLLESANDVVPAVLLVLRLREWNNAFDQTLATPRERFMYTCIMFHLLLYGTNEQRPHRPNDAWSRKFLIP